MRQDTVHWLMTKFAVMPVHMRGFVTTFRLCHRSSSQLTTLRCHLPVSYTLQLLTVTVLQICMIKRPILSSVFCRYLSNYSLLTLIQCIDGKLSTVQLYRYIRYKIEICICEKFVRKINGMASSNKMCRAASARGSVSAGHCCSRHQYMTSASCGEYEKRKGS